jgi:hypothetical protein
MTRPLARVIPVLAGLACACLYLLTAAGALAQSATVSGTVRDSATGETLIQANVVVEGTTQGASSNAQGFYSLAGLPPGETTLLASYIGYEPLRTTVNLGPGERLRLDISLQPRAVDAGEVVVEAEVPLAEERAVGLQEVGIRLIQQIPSAVEDDLFRSLQFLPGVKPASDFSSRLYIRGGSPDQTLILLDQTTVYNPTHFFGFFSTFNTDAIKDVRVWKGGYPAEYGGRLGSVIDVYNRDGNRNRLAGRASLGLLASRARIEGPVSVGDARGSFFLAGRRSTLEPLLAVLRNYEDNVPESFYFYDVNAKVGLDLTTNDRLSLALYAGLDDVVFPFAENAEFELRYGNQTGSLNYTRIISDRVFTTLRATASRYANYPEALLAGTTFRRENIITDYSLKGDVEWLAGRDLGLKAGFWGGRLALRLNDFFDGRETLASRIDASYGSVYAEATWQPRPWHITAGLRTQYFSDGGYFRLEPRLSIQHYLSERAIVQAAYGRYNQFLSLISNEAFTGFDVWVTTGEGVPPAYGDQFVLGLKTRPTDRYSVDLEVYYRTLRDLFELDPRIQDVSGREYADLFRFGDGYAAGAELFVERRTGRVTGFLGYTAGITQRRFAGAGGEPFNPDPVTGEPQFYSPKYDRTHDVSAVVNVAVGGGWELTSAFVYATGQAFTRVGGYYQVSPFPGTDATTIVTTGYNRARLPPYHRMDLGVTRSGRFFGIGEYEARVQMINVYNRRNLWFYFLDRSDELLALEPVRQLPILPNLSLTVDF